MRSGGGRGRGPWVGVGGEGGVGGGLESAPWEQSTGRKSQLRRGSSLTSVYTVASPRERGRAGG